MVTFTRSPKGKHHLIPRLDYRDQKMREVVQWHRLLSSADKLASDTGWNIRAFWEAVEDGDFPRADHVFRGAVQAYLNVRTDGEAFIDPGWCAVCGLPPSEAEHSGCTFDDGAVTR